MKVIYKSLFLIVVLILTGCVPKQDNSNVVSVSILPQKYFVDELTGGELEVNVMLAPGTSHVTYSPTPLQFKKLSNSKLYIHIGYLGYEQAWIGRLKELNPDIVSLNLSDKTELIGEEAFEHGDHLHMGSVDPHIWMSPAVMLEILPSIKSSLISNYPYLKDTIEARYPKLLAEVEATHKKMIQTTSLLTNRSFLIFHPVLTYLARDYGLEQFPIEQDGKEPSPAQLARTIEKAKNEGVKIVFIQKEYDVRNAQLVSEETGTKLVQIDPMAYNWVEIMNELIVIFQENLR